MVNTDPPLKDPSSEESEASSEPRGESHPTQSQNIEPLGENVPRELDDPSQQGDGSFEDIPDAANPFRHPTGTPDLTGGWMADSFLPENQPTSQDERSQNQTEPHPDSDTPRSAPPPPVQQDLPKRVTEADLGATRVSTTAYISEANSGQIPPQGTIKPRSCGGCLLRMAILSIFIVAAAIIGVTSFGLYQYFSLASTLPSVEDLETHAAQFETTRILDREGNLLYEILDPQAGRRTYVPIDEISPYLIAAIVATEDSQFYSNPGFDLAAIVRALWQNYTQGEVVSGASTITQQVARNLLFTPEERARISARRKTREILLAAEITRRYSKDDILELYLNQSFFGNLAYGVEAAAETYFDTTADKLTLSQASFLAGLVQAPSVYNIYTNRDATLNRQRQVLTLMMETSLEQGCIYVSNAQQPICVPPEEAGAAAAETTNYEFQPLSFEMQFPHWVNFIRGELEQLYDPQTIYRSGFTVFTTIDPVLQIKAQETVRAQVDSLADHRATNGALVAIRPATGEILAMVGSPDFNNEDIDGQINMAVQPRQPGSSFKPITYTAAFEKGWTPATLIWDVPSEFPPSGNPDDPRPPYEPVNYDERFHGPVLVRSALANSYNVPAVKALDFVGIYDDPTTPEKEGLVSFAERVGITTFTRDDYGLSLTLGGGDVSLLELTSVYATYANGGSRVPPTGILRIEDSAGALVYEFEQPVADQVIRPEHAYMITDILSDNAARTPAFGPNSDLRLPFQAAAKTGTTNDFRDNWTLGYTPDFAVGVWVGNADYTPMEKTSGLSGAAPIWNEVMQFAADRLSNGQPKSFSRPPGIIDEVICALSGAKPSEWCPAQRSEIFSHDQPPLPKEQDLWREAWIDTYSLELASAECPDFAEEKLGISVHDPWAREWLKEDKKGKAWAEELGFEEDEVFFIPGELCTEDSPRPIIAFTDPNPGSLIFQSPLSVFGRAAGTSDFKDWILEYQDEEGPSGWPDLIKSDSPFEQPEKLFDWDIRRIGNGRIILRLTVRSKRGGKASVTLPLEILQPTPTPNPTPTPTMTMTPTPTQTSTTLPTDTITPTPTPSPTPP